MIKKVLIYICLLSSLLLVLDTVNAANSLLLFLFAGVIPGTNLLIAPIDMMAATATAITIVILRLTLWPRLRNVLLAEPPKQARAKRTTRRIA